MGSQFFLKNISINFLQNKIILYKIKYIFATIKIILLLLIKNQTYICNIIWEISLLCVGVTLIHIIVNFNDNLNEVSLLLQCHY